MRQIKVRKLNVDKISAIELSALLDQERVEYNSIDTMNWGTFPYKPEVKFRIVHTENAILINYKVEEDSVRAVYGEDNGNVWTDSCVELFVIPANDGVYYNIESNCIGTILIGGGKERHQRERAGAEILSFVQRWSSLGENPFEEREGKCSWELSLIIPYKAFFKHSIKSLSGTTVKGNFYKCGDQLKTPHYISWNRIETEKPDFHRPEFFGKLCFE